MRLIPWRAMRPEDVPSSPDKERLEERLAKLVGGPANQPTDGAASNPAQAGVVIVPNDGKPTAVHESREPNGGTAALTEVGVALDAVALQVRWPQAGDSCGASTGTRTRGRRRPVGFRQ